MVPFLRIVPIGGVCLTALVLVLALEPPGKPPRVVSPDMVLARGPLMDRAEHPEWPQMLVRSAYMRADEILKLRDLPDTPTRVPPIILPPQRPAIAEAKPAPAAAAQPGPDQSPAAPQPVTRTASLPANVDAVKPAPESPPTSVPQPAENAAVQDKASAAPAPPSKTVASLPSAATVKPDAAAEPSVASAPSAAVAPPADIAPALEAKTAASPPAATNRVPMPQPKPAKLAALPTEGAPSAPVSDDVAGAIADSSNATIPVDIGEASSTELPIVLPRERPAILRIRRRGEERRRAQPRHQAKAAPKAKLPGNEQPASQVNLFDQLFDTKDAANGKKPAARPRDARTTAKQAASAPSTPVASPYQYTPRY